MSVEFEENNFGRRTYTAEPVPKLAAWIIDHKLAKDVAGANRIEVIAACFFFALSFYFFFF